MPRQAISGLVYRIDFLAKRGRTHSNVINSKDMFVAHEAYHYRLGLTILASAYVVDLFCIGRSNKEEKTIVGVCGNEPF